MAGKSQRGRGRHLPQSKKRKSRRTSPAIAAQTYMPPTTPTVSAPTANRSAPMPTPTVARYPYVATELRRIGILAGIIVVILVVLALVLP